jgi:hypothetical protein
LGDLVHEDKLCHAALTKAKDDAAQCDTSAIALQRKYVWLVSFFFAYLPVPTCAWFFNQRARG